MTAFREHVASTLELFAAVVRHGNESDEAETVRDVMGATWAAMNTRQRKAADELAATINEFLYRQPLG